MVLVNMLARKCIVEWGLEVPDHSAKRTAAKVTFLVTIAVGVMQGAANTNQRMAQIVG
jgi:hypothetical protein